MTIATATDPCLALGQSTRTMIFHNSYGRFARVLNSVTLPGLARVGSDGTVTLPTHESMEVIFEATYVWNGATYTFSPFRSHKYDVALGERRPYEIPIQLIRGGAAVTLSGTFAYHFGNGYDFEAVAGETLTIELKHAGIPPQVTLYYQDEISSIVELSGRSNWSGTLRKSGTYHLLVFGTNELAAVHRSRYVIRLTAR